MANALLGKYATLDEARRKQEIGGNSYENKGDFSSKNQEIGFPKGDKNKKLSDFKNKFGDGLPYTGHNKEPEKNYSRTHGYEASSSDTEDNNYGNRRNNNIYDSEESDIQDDNYNRKFEKDSEPKIIADPVKSNINRAKSNSFDEDGVINKKSIAKSFNESNDKKNNALDKSDFQDKNISKDDENANDTYENNFSTFPRQSHFKNNKMHYGYGHEPRGDDNMHIGNHKSRGKKFFHKNKLMSNNYGSENKYYDQQNPVDFRDRKHQHFAENYRHNKYTDYDQPMVIRKHRPNYNDDDQRYPPNYSESDHIYSLNDSVSDQEQVSDYKDDIRYPPKNTPINNNKKAGQTMVCDTQDVITEYKEYPTPHHVHKYPKKNQSKEDEYDTDWKPRIKKIIVPGKPREVCVVKVIPIPVDQNGLPWKKGKNSFNYENSVDM